MKHKSHSTIKFFILNINHKIARQVENHETMTQSQVKKKKSINRKRPRKEEMMELIDKNF